MSAQEREGFGVVLPANPDIEGIKAAARAEQALADMVESHPESDTRCRCELTATGSGADPNCAIHGAHPESDTRPYDAPMTETVITESDTRGLTREEAASEIVAILDDRWPLLNKIMAVIDRHTGWSASPDLSIDREARDALETAWAIIEANPTEDVCRHQQEADECPGEDGEPCTDRSRRDFIRGALRGTTQQEPTE